MNVEILKELKNAESLTNDGRGVSCVREVIFFLERGDLGSAEEVAYTESDKISSYPNLKTVLRRLLPDYDSFCKQWD